VVITGNIIENNWVAAQNGYSILITPRNQDGGAPWTVVQQVEFSNNIVRHVSSAINILGQDSENTSQPTNNIMIRNNLFVDVNRSTYGGDGRLLLINGASNITLDHNTVMQDGTSVLFSDERPVWGFSFTNNIVPDNGWAIMGSGTGPGNGTISSYYPNGLFLDGIYIGSRTSLYPTGNYYPATIDLVGFVDPAGGDYRLRSSSIYRNAATDGADVGCDINALNNATAGVGP
jgi:hypothetical protein